MSLLTVVLLPLVISVSIIGLQTLCRVVHNCRCGSAERDEGINNQATSNHVSRHVPAITLGDAFRPETSMLWEPNIILLKAIDAADHSWQSETSLLPLYRRMTLRYPELFEGIGMTFYLQFLAEANLIAHRRGRVCLSDTGSAFLKWRVADQHEDSSMCSKQRGHLSNNRAARDVTAPFS